MALAARLHVGRNVTDLTRICAFYTDALGFSVAAAPVADPELAELLGVGVLRTVQLGLGAQILELTECRPYGGPYPRECQADDRCFQHIAIVTTDIHRAYTQALESGATAISSGGPILLPASSGGVWAWKFRDPDGHPVELLQFPKGSGWDGTALHLGYDHSALVVTDTSRSIEFYARLGLQLRHRQVNRGIEQDRLDGLAPSVVEVVALAASDTPHVELLGYTRAGAAVAVGPPDIAADRLVFSNSPGGLELRRDPDGHFVLLDGRKSR